MLNCTEANLLIVEITLVFLSGQMATQLWDTRLKYHRMRERNKCVAK